MIRFYLMPIETINNCRGPKYIQWSAPGVESDPADLAIPFSMMDYGFLPNALVLAKSIGQADHDNLVANSDVFGFPENLDQPVSDPGIDTFFEAVNIPTDWLTPSTSYREMLRQMAGMFQFNQRYGGISGVNASLFDNATLDTRLREMSDQEQAWFLATVESFGYEPALVPTNAKLRQLVKTAGTYWDDQTFYMGGVAF